jgi:CRP-like cAMP-binding protein
MPGEQARKGSSLEGAQRARHAAEGPAGERPGAGRPVVAGNCGQCITREHCLIGALPQSVAGLGPGLRERSFQRGDMLLREGEREARLRIVKVGTVFVCRDQFGGSVHPLGIGARGMVLGLCGYAKQPNQTSVIASTAGRYCEIPVPSVEALAQNDPVFRERLGKAFTDNIAFMARWAQLRGHRGVMAQVAGSVALIAEEQRTDAIDVPSHMAFARMLGTTRESVARAMAALERAGCLVRTAARRCTVNAQALRVWLAANA